MQKKYEYIKEQCDLAVAYAKDGAYYSAARVLQSLANDTADHANAVLGEALAEMSQGARIK